MAELRPLVVHCDCCTHQRAHFVLRREDGTTEGYYCEPCSRKAFERLALQELGPKGKAQ